MKPTDTMTDDTKPESASEREKNLAAVSALEATEKFSKLSSPPLDQGERNMYRWGFEKGAKWQLDRQEKTILELRAALRKIHNIAKDRICVAEDSWESVLAPIETIARETLARNEVK